MLDIVSGISLLKTSTASDLLSAVFNKLLQIPIIYYTFFSFANLELVILRFTVFQQQHLILVLQRTTNSSLTSR